MIDIIPYEPRYQPDFKRLNLEWISRYFTVEPHDLEQLDQPERYVLPNQGQIFLARRSASTPGVDAPDNEIVGCVAVVNTGSPGASTSGQFAGAVDAPVFELAKMAVSPDVRGQGIGKRLALAAIDYARQIGAQTLWLESNRILTPALMMYERVGFCEVPSVPTPYARADIRMEMTL